MVPEFATRQKEDRVRRDDTQARRLDAYWYRLGARGGLSARVDTGSELPVAPTHQTVPVPLDEPECAVRAVRMPEAVL